MCEGASSPIADPRRRKCVCRITLALQLAALVKREANGARSTANQGKKSAVDAPADVGADEAVGNGALVRFCFVILCSRRWRNESTRLSGCAVTARFDGWSLAVFVKLGCIVAVEHLCVLGHFFKEAWVAAAKEVWKRIFFSSFLMSLIIGDLMLLITHDINQFRSHFDILVSALYSFVNTTLNSERTLSLKNDEQLNKKTVIRQQKSTLKLEQFQHSPQKPSDQWASGRERLARLPRGSRGTTNSSPFSCLREDLGSLFDPAASRAGRLSGGLWERKFSEFSDFLMSFCRDFMMRLI